MGISVAANRHASVAARVAEHTQPGPGTADATRLVGGERAPGDTRTRHIWPFSRPADFKIAPNVRAERFVPHSAVLPHVAAMVTQCGLGTVGKALACGVSLLCIPLRADQPDNAARIVARGVGIRVRSDARSEEIGSAIRRLMTEPQFRRAASALSVALMQEGDAEQERSTKSKPSVTPHRPRAPDGWVSHNERGGM